MTDPFTCLEPYCSDPPAVRGLCRRCHNRRTAQVKRGKTTWQELEAAGLAHRTTRKYKPCLTPDCPAKSKSRGLCDTCYCKYRKLVYEEITTWEALEAAGKSLPVMAKDGSRRRLPDILPLPKKQREMNLRKPREYQANGDGTYSVREWERQYFARLDAYLATRMGSREARQALDAWLNE